MPVSIKTDEQRARLGAKWTCTACEVRFYDLHRDPATCPSCGQVQDQEPPEKPKKKRKSTRKKSTAKKSTRKKSTRSSRNKGLDEAAVQPEETIELEGHGLGEGIATASD